MTDISSGATPIRTLLLPRHHWPAIALGLLAIAGIVHGPVAQLPDYHAFADQHALFSIPHGQDVLSNLPFALVALWGGHRRASRDGAAWLALATVVSVAWWHFTELGGHGDLRPYLMLQLAPMLLIPLWQMIYRAEATERRAFGGALLLYAVAKFAELNDHAILAVTGVISGHTLKHLLASAAAWMIVRSLMRRTCDPASCPFSPDPGSVAPTGR